MERIFDRQPLRPFQWFAVAEKRFGDARALCSTRDNERANGAMYLAGFVVEIMLKAKLLQLQESISKSRQAVANNQTSLSQLIWKSHDLVKILAALPAVEATVKKAGERAGKPFDYWLKGICSTWTIYARYSSRSSTIADAQLMLDRVRQLKEILR